MARCNTMVTSTRLCIRCTPVLSFSSMSKRVSGVRTPKRGPLVVNVSCLLLKQGIAEPVFQVKFWQQILQLKCNHVSGVVGAISMSRMYDACKTLPPISMHAADCSTLHVHQQRLLVHVADRCQTTHIPWQSKPPPLLPAACLHHLQVLTARLPWNCACFEQAFAD